MTRGPTVGVNDVALAERQVEQLRERLLDLSNRNKLLNFRHPDRSRTQVRVIDELPAVLYEALLSGKPHRFKGIPDPRGGQPGAKAPIEPVARQHGLDPSFDLGVRRRGNEAAHHVDGFIQLLHYPSEMERRLEGMRQEHMTSLQELGVPALYGVFGFLEWYESATSPKPLLSPLVLLPLEIERSRERGEYRHRVTCSAEEPESNRTLVFRLRGMGVDLPSIDGLIASEDLDAYLAEVAVAVADMPRWRVRRMVTFGVLSFARQVMYEDLTTSRWQGRGGRAACPLVRRLLVGGEDDLGEVRATAEVVALEPEPLLITDADATQVAAIADALSGRSIVVKGPPGTGKSQTITNLIGAALALGKTVLFVAEKMAALDVVKKRLDDAGLSPFCLALHSTKAKKRDVIDALARSREARKAMPPPRGKRERESELRELRDELERYMQAVSAPVGELGISVREIVWREQQLRGELAAVPPEILQLSVPGAERMTRSQLEEARRRLVELENAAAALGGPPGQHPWRFVSAWDPLRHHADALHTAISRWQLALRALLTPFAGLPWRVELMTLGELGAFADRLSDLIHVDASASPDLIQRVSQPRLIKPLMILCDAIEERRALAQRVAAVCSLEAALPQRERFLRLVGAVESEGLASSSQRIAELPSIIAARTAGALALREAVRMLQELGAEAAMPGVWDAAGQRVLLRCGQLAGGVPRDVLRARPAEPIERDVSVVLQRGRSAAAALRAQRVRLDERMSGWREVGPTDLRRHAMVLRSTGFFGRLFGARFRASRLEYLTLTTGKGASREEMAADMQEAAEYLEAEARFATDPELARVAGPAFRGVETDFDLVELVLAWSHQVQRAFEGHDVRARWARRVLLQGAADWLEALAGVVEGVGESLDAVPADHDLAIYAQERVSRAQRLADAFQAGASLELDGRTSLSELTNAGAALAQITKLDERLDAAAGSAEALGPWWRGPMTDTGAVRVALAANATIEEIGLPPFVVSWLVSTELRARLQQGVEIAERLQLAFRDEQEARDGARHAGVTLGEVAAPETPLKVTSDTLSNALSATPEALAAWLQHVACRSVCDQLPGLAAFCRALESAQGAWRQIPDLFEWCVLRRLEAESMRAHPEIPRGAWSGGRLDQMRERIRRLEHELLSLRRESLVAKLSASQVPRGRGSGLRSEWTNDALLANEVAKKRKHIPIRQLMSRARSAVLALTPCLMMSPLSVAQFLEDPDFEFDLLVIDEASQLRPEDALGALLRAKQAVIVGDEQQLPPTEFFRRASEESDGEREADVEDLQTESILDLAMRVLGEPRVLRWHYRSRHESLIAFSNHQFYDGRLVVAPAPRGPASGAGVSVRHVKGTYEASTNPPEADAVVDVVVDLMREHPERSIGVAALNQQQSDLIREKLDERLRGMALDFVERWSGTLEPFFVKNLENVQGDERDAIVVSLTFGPDPTGRVFQRFGPINGANGHRRLNVLFSRAKHHLVLVTSLRVDDVRIGPASQRGVHVLRSYLEYAAGCAAGPATWSRSRSSHYPRLARELENLGFDVDADVGSQSLTLDLGVRHPSSPRDFIAGVEVDAGGWMGPALGRDRDGTRSVVLENLGWTVASTWTTDWMRNRGALESGSPARCSSRHEPAESECLRREQALRPNRWTTSLRWPRCPPTRRRQRSGSSSAPASGSSIVSRHSVLAYGLVEAIAATSRFPTSSKKYQVSTPRSSGRIDCSSCATPRVATARTSKGDGCRTFPWRTGACTRSGSGAAL